ncbi:MAG: branched-chain amino acid aminotransferase [Chitinophagaceae bacterium]|nr:branched-chain amino acid aminotransferase [Chitinophagaceae bacterium]MCW5927180.1 branched-chain amino acid aminotransferase [Chitinophagaceae bacterium]
MVAALDIQVTKVERSKLSEINLDNLPFGKYFTDHMLEAEYENGKWTNVEIKPYQPLLLDPSLAAIHYGQSIFEGIKAYKDAAGNAFIFRPYDNLKRFNLSALRMNMPEVPEEIFIEGMRRLIEVDKEWIPGKKEHSLYIRPFMFATDCMLGVRPSTTYKFLIILSPTGPYFPRPMKIRVEEKYTRAVKGGVGFAKNAGNYGGSLLAATEAQAEGYDQVLWTDAVEHKWLQEVGMMNVFFVLKDKVVTPSLEDGTILNGVTRNSVITVLKDMGADVEERPVHVNEIVAAHKTGELKEVFGTGTAATIAYVETLAYGKYEMNFSEKDWELSTEVKRRLTAIRDKELPDTNNWLFNI